jgi:hypothetical protein
MKKSEKAGRNPERVFRVLSSCIDAYHRCVETKNTEWAEKHIERISAIMDATAPSGSGIDSGTEIQVETSTGEKLVFTLGFHHMDENGSYDGWTNHTIFVRPSFIHTLDLKISGPNRGDIKEYLHEVFYSWLTEKTTL